MRIESPAFTEHDIRGFLDEQFDYERHRLADRLAADSERLAKLAPTLTLPRERRREETQDWTGHDILAHIAVLSKFYGTVVYRVGSGKLSQIELLEAVKGRDPAGEQLRSLTPDQLLGMIELDHQRTIAYLRSADATAMQRRAVLYEDFSMSAAEIAQLPLCAHLEIHLDQLERALRH